MSAQKKLDFSETVTLLKLVKVVFLCYIFGFEKLSFNFSFAGGGRYQNQAALIFMVSWLIFFISS